MKPALRIEGGGPAWIGLRGGSEVVRAQAEAYATSASNWIRRSAI